MNKTQKNIIIVFIFCIINILFCIKVEAAGIGMSINKSSAYVGDTFTVTISGINGKVKITGNSNISISPSGTQFVRGNLTITGTAKSVGTGTVTVTPEDVSTTGANPVEVTQKANKSITITEKPVEKPQQTTQTQTNNNKTTSSNNTNSSNKTTTKNTNTKISVAETKEKEEATLQLGIYSLKLIGVKENGEEVDVSLDKEFNINTLDYTCNIANDIKTVRIEKEAYEYNDIVQISGLEEELKIGENNIILKLAKDGKEVNYQIKVIKEEKKEEPSEELSQETSVIPEETTEQEGIIVSIPLVWFILLELVVIGASVGITIAVMLYLKQDKSDIKEGKNSKKNKEEEQKFKKIE